MKRIRPSSNPHRAALPLSKLSLLADHRMSYRLMIKLVLIAIIAIIYPQATYREFGASFVKKSFFCHALIPTTSRNTSRHSRRKNKDDRIIRTSRFPSPNVQSTTRLSFRTQSNTINVNKNQRISHNRAFSSPLFANQKQRIRIQQRSSSSTALHMVLTTPESIIEQASTINLLDDLIDESVRTSARRPIMMQFDPSSGWIWRRWTGTIFAETWTSCVRNMIYAFVIFLVQRSYPTMNNHLSGFGTLWGQLLSVTTFTLTFFVNQSYSLWRKCMELSRRLQGRLHDINMNLVTHAARKIPSNPNEKSTYTASSRQILELMSRYVRLFNLLTYASFTRSHRPILTPRGMRRLVERGLMTASEREVLVDAAIPATQRHSVVLMWMVRLFIEGRESGHIQGGAGFESETMHKFHIIRSQYGAIGDELQGRMPLAYAHIVQVLVDLILWMFPIMAFSTGMSPLLVIVGTGLLTISYQGLFDLAKQFLDPYDNENYGRGEDPLCVDTLIAETNAGSVRWLYGFEEMPFSAQRVYDGEMYDYLLPVRGYSVEELAQMEEERIEREKQLEEQRKREKEEAKEQIKLESNETEVVVLSEIQDANYTVLEAPSSTAVNVTMPREGLKKKSKKVSGSGRNKTAIQAETESANVTLILTEDIINNVTTKVVQELKTNKTAIVDALAEDVRAVHKITTFAGKPIVNFQPSDTIKAVIEEPVPSNTQTTNYLATLGENGKRKGKGVPTNNFVPDMVEFEEIQGNDETGPDGQEIRQQLADEMWAEDSGDIETKTMTLEEYQDRVKEIQDNADNELRETIEILSASPGADGNENLYTVTERKKKKNKATYNQTRLDGTPQLLGLPPEDPSSLSEYEPPEKRKDTSFDSITQLPRGKPIAGSSSSRSSRPKAEDNEIVGLESFSGTSDLWGSNLDEFQDTVDKRAASIDSVNGNDDGNQPKGEDPDQLDSDAGIPWHNEKAKDGKEYRLSETIADEEYIIEPEPEEQTAMTLEDYNKQVKEILSQAEEEMRETEAILMSKPGTDPVGWDYDDDKLAPMSNSSKVEESDEEVAEEENQMNKDDNLTVLEMDSGDDDIVVNGDNMPVETTMDANVTFANGDTQAVISDKEDVGQKDSSGEENAIGSLAEEEERLEEEAILSAKPGTDPVGWDYEEERLNPMVNESAKQTQESKEDDGSDGEILSSVDEIETDQITKGERGDQAIESVSDSDSVEIETTDISSEKKQNGNVKGSDIVQPIFLDGDDSQSKDQNAVDSNNK